MIDPPVHYRHSSRPIYPILGGKYRPPVAPVTVD